MTVNGYAVREMSDKRGPIKPGFPADLIAVNGNPLESIDALRDVRFVMKDGVVFKRDGLMTPEKFFHSGPVPPGSWRLHSLIPIGHNAILWLRERADAPFRTEKIPHAAIVRARERHCRIRKVREAPDKLPGSLCRNGSDGRRLSRELPGLDGDRTG